VGYAGARHLIQAANTKARLDSLEYEFERLEKVMLDHDLTTVQLIWTEGPSLFHSGTRSPLAESPKTQLRASRRLRCAATSGIAGGWIRLRGLPSARGRSWAGPAFSPLTSRSAAGSP